MAIPEVNLRIKEIIDQEAKGQTSVFADKIKINRATISNTINGRTDKEGKRYYPNPPTEVLQCIIHSFPKINSEWLLSGKPPMYNTKEPTFFPEDDANVVNDTPQLEYSKENRVKEVKNEPKKIDTQEIKPPIFSFKKIDKIVIFYSDNTYESFHPDK
jgi:hypothetical protein